MNAKQILLRVFSGILALVCILSLVLTGYGFRQTLDCKAYWESEAEEANEGFDKLEDGINQLRDNEDAYLTGVEAYEEGLEEYEKGEEDLEKGEDKLSSGQAQYNDGASQLAAAHQQYNENVAKINEAKAKVEAGKAELEAGRAEVEAELAAHRQEYEEGKAQLETVTPIYNAAMATLGRIDELKAQRDSYAAMGPLFEDKVTELDIAIAMAEAALDVQLNGYSVNGIIQAYQEGQAKIAAYEEGQRQVEAGKQKIAELANAGDQLAAGYAALEEGKDKLEAGAQQLSDGLAQLGEYEGGEEQVREGLDTVLATDTYYDTAKQPMLPAIAERLDPDFSYWKLDENGEPLVVNGQRFLSLAESLKVVRAGREFLADTTKLVTEEITGRVMISALAALAVLMGLVTAILGLAGRRIGALVCAVLSMLSGIAALAMAWFVGLEDPFSVIAGTGSVGLVLAGVAALVLAALLVLIFAAIPGSGRNKKTAPAPAEA